MIFVSFDFMKQTHSKMAGAGPNLAQISCHLGNLERSGICTGLVYRTAVLMMT